MTQTNRSPDRPAPTRLKRLVRAVILAALSAGAASAVLADGRVLPVRERATATLQEGDFTFKVVKLQGYSVDVRIGGEKRRLKLGDAFSPPEADCLITFEEISPETRIARFRTDCD